MNLDVLSACDDVSKIYNEDLLVIQRKYDDRKILVKVAKVLNKNRPGKEEILLGRSKNDYFIWNMYMDGTSWVKRVWRIGQVELTNITNNMNEFPRS